MADLREMQCANTDREIWRRGDGDGNGMSYYEPSIHVTKEGAIGMNVGGTVVTMPIEKWHQMALGRVSCAIAEPSVKPRRKPIREFLRESCDAPNWLFGALCLTAILNAVRSLVGG